MGRRTIHVNGIQLGAELRGEPNNAEHTLILLHGFTGSAASWGEHLDTFAVTGRRVIALDMLGHGQSDAPVDDLPSRQSAQRYSMEHCQTDILAALAALGVHKGEAILLGYSMGGRIALYTAFSSFFRALILESASAGLANSAEREQRKCSDEALATSLEHNGVSAFVEYWEQLPLFASQKRLPAEHQKALHTQRLNNRAIGLANSLRGIGTGAQPPLHDKLSTLLIPVLLIAGELDGKFCQIAKQMASILPQSQLQIVPNAGHAVHLEQPAAFDRLVINFCTSLSSELLKRSG
ncbi:MAG: 2-succinyl-6-hydroxy-2,4-cyclohexadiene-1-carboxylate synthase [Ktedonobacteraceae bacterium]